MRACSGASRSILSFRCSLASHESGTLSFHDLISAQFPFSGLPETRIKGTIRREKKLDRQQGRDFERSKRMAAASIANMGSAALGAGENNQAGIISSQMIDSSEHIQPWFDVAGE